MTDIRFTVAHFGENKPNLDLYLNNGYLEF